MIATAQARSRHSPGGAAIADYLRAVRAQTGKKLTAAQAALLTTSANTAAAALGC